MLTVLAVASQVQQVLPVAQAVVHFVIGVAAIGMFAKNYREKKDAESLGWCLLCILWTL